MPHSHATPADSLLLRARYLRIGCFANLVAFLLLVTVIVIVFPTLSRTLGFSTPAADEIAIRKVLDDQVTAWNRGDLDGFMAGYWRDENLLFTSGGQMRKGWNATRERYVQRYFNPAKPTERGELSFVELHVESLSPTAAVVRGRFLLKYSTKTDTGIFTLILRKMPEGWRIASDHTSVDCP